MSSGASRRRKPITQGFHHRPSVNRSLPRAACLLLSSSDKRSYQRASVEEYRHTASRQRFSASGTSLATNREVCQEGHYTSQSTRLDIRLDHYSSDVPAGCTATQQAGLTSGLKSKSTAKIKAQESQGIWGGC